MKYKKFAALILFIVMIFALGVMALGHGGKTDSNGGHYNHSTGEYHYHHGYSAHQHEDDECPYDFDDQTDHSPSTGSSYSSSSYAVIEEEPLIQTETKPKYKHNTGDIIALIIAIVFVGIPLVLIPGYYLIVTVYNIVSCIVDKIKRS